MKTCSTWCVRAKGQDRGLAVVTVRPRSNSAVVKVLPTRKRSAPPSAKVIANFARGQLTATVLEAEKVALEANSLEINDLLEKSAGAKEL